MSRYLVSDTWKADPAIHPGAVWLGLDKVDEPERGQEPQVTLDLEGQSVIAWRCTRQGRYLSLCVEAVQVDATSEQASPRGFPAGSIVGMHVLVGDLPVESEVS